MNKNIAEAMKSADLPRIYFNEFGVGMSKNDVLILLGRNGKKEAILNASHRAFNIMFVSSQNFNSLILKN